VEQKVEEGDEVARVAQLDWTIIECDVDKPFISSGLQFVPLPVWYTYIPSTVKCLLDLAIFPSWIHDGASFSFQVMHGEDYVCLGFLFGRKARVAYLSDVSRILPRTEHSMIILSLSFFIQPIWIIYLFMSTVADFGVYLHEKMLNLICNIIW
jgi:hypothetical protein